MRTEVRKHDAHRAKKAARRHANQYHRAVMRALGSEVMTLAELEHLLPNIASKDIRLAVRELAASRQVDRVQDAEGVLVAAVRP